MPPKTRARAAKSPLTPIEPEERRSVRKKKEESREESNSKSSKSGNNSSNRRSMTVSRITRSSMKSGHSHEENHHEECDSANETIEVILVVLYLLRIVLCLIPQHGYINRDEYFLFTEPIAGDIFQSKVIIGEEYDIRDPQVSTFFPLMIAGPPFGILSILSDVFGYIDLSPLQSPDKSVQSPDGSLQSPDGSSDRHVLSGHPVPPTYWILVLPRLVVTLLSFIADWSIARLLLPFGSSTNSQGISHSLGTSPSLGTVSVNNIRLMFATSFISLTFMTRTLWNSIELILFTILLLNAIVYHKLRTKDHCIWTAFTIGCILSIGFFNRPTFLILASVPLIWSLMSHTKIRSWSESVKKFLLITPMFFFQSSILIAFDTTYYSDIVDTEWIKVPLLDWIGIVWNKLTFTTLNFITKHLAPGNLEPGNLAPGNSSSGDLEPSSYLQHLRHLCINAPLLFGILVIPLVVDSTKLVISLIKREKNVTSSDSVMMLVTILTSLGIFSLSKNQEARILIPLIVPVCYLYRQLMRSRSFVMIWIMCNLLLTLIYGFALDAGVTSSVTRLHDIIHGLDMESVSKDLAPNNIASHKLGHQHVIFTSLPQPPLHLLNIAENNNLIRVFDYTGRSFPENINQHFSLLAAKNMTSKVVSYLINPSCLNDQVEAILRTTIGGAHVQKMDIVWPHLSPDLFWKSIDTLLISNYDFIQSFSLTIWRITG